MKQFMRHVITAVLLLVTLPATAAVDIFAAARAGDTAAITQFIEAGGDINQANSDTFTPFILAAYYNEIAAMEVLANADADVCAVDKQGSNAFMGVAFRGHVEAADWLLNNTDCGVNYQNYAGQTALMMASLFGREEIIELLLAEGAEPQLADRQGNTAESLARAQGLSWVVETIRFHLAARSDS